MCKSICILLWIENLCIARDREVEIERRDSVRIESAAIIVMK